MARKIEFKAKCIKYFSHYYYLGRIYNVCKDEYDVLLVIDEDGDDIYNWEGTKQYFEKVIEKFDESLINSLMIDGVEGFKW